MALRLPPRDAAGDILDPLGLPTDVPPYF